MTLSDQAFLDGFAARELGAEHFDHRGHLRMAWLHLDRYPLDEAVERVCTGIQALAIRFGAPEKYHRTVTEALLRIMALRMRVHPADDFNAFVAHNRDLVENAEAVLARYYSPRRLASLEAKQRWLAPDLATIDD